jgi:hypothetical protein
MMSGIVLVATIQSFEWMTTSASPTVEMKGLVNGFLNPMANYHSANE